MKEREKIKQRNRSYSVTATDKTMKHLNTHQPSTSPRLWNNTNVLLNPEFRRVLKDSVRVKMECSTNIRQHETLFQYQI